MITITHACGHTARIRVSGTAASKSQQIHAAEKRECAYCQEQRPATPDEIEATRRILFDPAYRLD